MRKIAKIITLAALLGFAASEADAQAPTYVGTFAMTNASSLNCLTETNAGGTLTDPGGAGGSAPWAATSDQEWAFLLLPSGYYAIFNLKSGHFLTDYSATGGGSGVGDEAWAAGQDQMWYLYPLGGHFYAIVNVKTGNMLADPTSGIGQYPRTTTWTDDLDQWWYLYFLFK